MATVPRKFVKLANTLPPRLTRFFARYPPPALLSSSQPQIASNTSSSDPNASSVETIAPELNVDLPESPFRAHKHSVTGKWHDPTFSLRRQAELVKLARTYGVEEFLPYTVKGTLERLRRREENGLRVKGTGIGQKVRGKEWERTLKPRYVSASEGWQCHILLREWLCDG